jgi:N-acetylglucosamine kinase-like BadF-type ATPase
LCDASGQLIGKGLSGSTNPRSTPAAELGAHLLEAIQQASASVEASSIQAIHLGIAGGGDTASQAALAEIARKCIGTSQATITVGHDLEIALVGGLGGQQTGMVLVAGTGSACYGRDAQGSTAQCGGWGDLVDDAGSGSWIGLRALQAAVRQADGRQAASALLPKVMGFLRIEDMGAFKARIHQVGLARSERAEIAPLILDLAQAGDGAATEILAEAIEELCALAAATHRQLQLPEPRLLLAGGLAENQHFYELLKKAHDVHIADATPTHPQLNSVAGAALLALEHAGVATSKDTIRNLENTSYK